MTLLNPLALAFAALLPLIVVLYLLKLRRQPAQVSTLMFWQRVTADNRRRALFQRLRQILSLLLHLFIFALLLFALARPELRAFRGSEAGLSTVVILDARARTQARTGNHSTRFDEARQIAASYLRRATVRQPAALLVMDAAARVAAGLTDDEKSLLAALDATRPTDAGGRLEDAVTLAGQLLASRPGGHRIVLVTDHPLAPPPGIPPTELETQFVGTPGTPRENVGLTRLSARALPGSPETDEVFVELENFGEQRQSGRVELTFEGRLLDVKSYDLAPGERRADVYPALAARTGVANARGWLTAHLAPTDPAADAFAPDDDAFAVIPPPRPARVLLVTRGNFFLESLLKADEQIAFDQLTPDAFQPAQAAGFDAVILDDVLPPELATLSALPPGNFLFLRRAPVGPATDPELSHPLITDLDTASPLLRLVNLRDVTLLRAQSWTLPDPDPTPGGWRFGAPVRSLEHPLVITGERGTQRFVALAFGAADSDLPLRVAFPLFIHDAVGWLAGRGQAAETPDSLRAGEPIVLDAGETLWTRPQHAFQPINDIPATEKLPGPGVFQPMHNGFYLRTDRDGSTRWLAVNTDARDQSALNGSTVGTGTASSAPTVTSGSSGWETLHVWPPWVYLALAAFTVCTLEWWGFHRRRTE